MADEAHSGSVIVMEESKRLLVRQEADLDTLRGRVGVILTGSSIVAAVFGGALPDDISRVAWAWRFSAFLMFAATAAVCIWILFPRGDWAFSTDLKEWIDDIQDPDDPVATHEVVRAYARYYYEMKDENRPRLERLQTALAYACVGLAAQVLLWALVVLTI